MAGSTGWAVWIGVGSLMLLCATSQRLLMEKIMTQKRASATLLMLAVASVFSLLMLSWALAQMIATLFV